MDPQKCSGCHLCEMVCSLLHLGAINIEKSAIRIHKDDLGTSLNTPILCRQCMEMKCLTGEEVTGVLEKKKFFWKRTRAERCSFNALTVLDGEAYHCDLCGGNPQCVKVCTPKAIQVIQIAGRESVKKKYLNKKENYRDNPDCQNCPYFINKLVCPLHRKKPAEGRKSYNSEQAEERTNGGDIMKVGSNSTSSK